MICGLRVPCKIAQHGTKRLLQIALIRIGQGAFFAPFQVLRSGLHGLLGGGEWVPGRQPHSHEDPGPFILSHCHSLSHPGKLRKRHAPMPLATAAPMPPELRAFLTLHATVGARDEEATRQVLREVAIGMPPRSGHKVVTMLQRSISIGARVWLQKLA